MCLQAAFSLHYAGEYKLGHRFVDAVRWALLRVDPPTAALALVWNTGMGGGQAMRDRDVLVQAIPEHAGFRQVKVLDVAVWTGSAAVERLVEQLLQGMPNLVSLKVKSASPNLSSTSYLQLKHLVVSADSFESLSNPASQMPLVETIHLWTIDGGSTMQQLNVRGCRGLRNLMLESIHVQQLFTDPGCRLGQDLTDFFEGLEEASVLIDLPPSLAKYVSINFDGEVALSVATQAALGLLTSFPCVSVLHLDWPGCSELVRDAAYLLMDLMLFDGQPLSALRSIIIDAVQMSGTIPAKLPSLEELVVRCEGRLELYFEDAKASFLALTKFSSWKSLQ